jgi:acetyltransferase
MAAASRAALDRLLDVGGSRELSEATHAALDAKLPTRSRANPVDIIGDAGAALYEAAR